MYIIDLKSKNFKTLKLKKKTMKAFLHYYLKHIYSQWLLNMLLIFFMSFICNYLKEKVGEKWFGGPRCG